MRIPYGRVFTGWSRTGVSIAGTIVFLTLGPVAGGWAFDIFHCYGWFHIGSFVVGPGAVAIA